MADETILAPQALTGPSTHLREVRLEDAAFLSKEAGHCDVARMCGSIPTPFHALSAEGYILCMRARARVRGDRLKVILDGDAAPAGIIGLHPRSDGAWELGYWLARSHWHQGHATRAAQLMLEEARTMGVSRLVANYFEDNPASGRVLERLGFTPTGERNLAWSMGRLGKAWNRRLVLTL